MNGSESSTNASSNPRAEVSEIPSSGCKPGDADLYSKGIFYHDSPLSHPITLFMLQIVLIVYLSQLIHLGLRCLKQPRVISFLVGGILTGPTLPYLAAMIMGKWGQEMLRYRDEYVTVFFAADQIALLRTLAYFGLMLSFFVMGIKMEPLNAIRSGKEAVAVGVSSFLLPLVVLVPTIFALLGDSDGFGGGGCLYNLVLSLSITGFPVLTDILAELRMLNTELGRFALSASLVNSILGCAALLVSTALSPGSDGFIGIVFFSFIPWFVFIFFVFPFFLRWIAPKDGHVREVFVLCILISVMVAGLVGDTIGVTFLLGPFLMGVVVPDGPTAGLLVQRVDVLANEVLLPLVFLIAGMASDVRALGQFKQQGQMRLLFLISFVTKLAGTMLPAIICKIPVLNAALLGLTMNFKGLWEVITLVMLRNNYMVTTPAYTHILLYMALTTSITAPLVNILYDPLRSNPTLACRNLQELTSHAELRLLVPVSGEEGVPTIISLVEASCAIKQSPLCALVLRVEESAGRVSTIVQHKNKKGLLINPSQMDRIFSPFTSYEQIRRDTLALEPFTAILPFKTMHRDICSMAVEKGIALLLLPVPKEDAVGHTDVDRALWAALPLFLHQAPCSVGIFIQSTMRSPKVLDSNRNLFEFKVEVLFWGGADDREALAYGTRMAKHKGVRAKVTHFVVPSPVQLDGGGHADDTERALDKKRLKSFKSGHGASDDHLSIEKKIVNTPEEMAAGIQSVNRDCDIVIVGRRQPQGLYLEEALAEWVESPDLGMVGDTLASSDFRDSSFSLLIIQHHT